MTLANISARLRRAAKTLATPVVLLTAAGCSFHPIYTPTGDVLAGYSESNATPYVMQMSDPGMACSLGESLDPLVYSFKRVTSAPAETGSLLMLLAGNCSEYRAWEAELEYLGADYAGEVPAAKDARERAKRLNAETAKRRYLAFQRAMEAYDYEPGNPDAQCPFFYDDQDEITFLLGLLTGMQAIVNDANSGAMAGVPRDIAPQAERAARCVDNEKWAGLPNAIRAMVWLLIPDTRPDDARDPWLVFAESSKLSVDRGIRAAMALEVVAAETFGRQDVREDVIARFADADNRIDVWEEYQLVDEVARGVIQFSSDKYWTANYGYRTPQSRFGSLSERSETTDAEVMDLDDLL
ncbi:MAG: hypothetical protein R3280_11535 [Marinobacter sp.]|uniref:hypothetical protein n=1 Tax=Marinobacter sp. TaxID=50741 RepID=UPI00299DF0DF|nr:hypothetical protein [Marinobacter sp.]MDX1635265.1 hypothetical protein [Marinobacter sp.]